MLSLEEEPEGELSNNGTILIISAAAVCVLLLVLGLLGLYYRSRVQSRVGGGPGTFFSTHGNHLP